MLTAAQLVDLSAVQSYQTCLLTASPQGPIHSLAFSPNGKFLASGATDGRVLLWDIGHGLMIGELKGHTDTIYSLRFSRDGEILASGGFKKFSKCFQFYSLKLGA